MWKKTIKKGVSIIVISMFILMFFMAYGVFASSKEEAGTAKDVTEKDIFAEPAELVFWWYGEDEVPGMTKYIEAVSAKYNELHPNITVKPEHQPIDAVVPNFLAAAAAQSGPDIATMWGGLYQLEHVWAGNIEPLSDYVSEEEMSHWPTKGLSEYDGKVWASDVFALGFAAAYNVKHFKDAGLDPEKPPATWEEFMEVSGKLKAAGHEPFVVGWKGGYQFVASGGHWLFQYITVEDLKETVVGIKKFTDRPGLIDVFEKIDEYNRAGYFIEAAMSLDQAQAWPEWRRETGTFAMLAHPLIFTYMEEVPDTFKIMPSFSKLPGSRYSLPGPPIFVFSQFITPWSENKELAADFLVFLHSQESFKAMVDTLGGTLTPVDDRFNPNLIKDPIRREFAEIMMETLRHDSVHMDEYLPWAITGENIVAVVEQLILKRVTPEEAAALVEKNAEEWRTLNPEYVENYKKWIGR